MDFSVDKIKNNLFTYHYRLDQKVNYMYRRLSLFSQAKGLREWIVNPWLVQS